MTASATPARAGRVGEVFLAFLRLGVTAFGGPVAHLGYFRAEFVVRRRWLDDRRYGELVAVSQFLPGPSSSQVGFALGLLRAGPLGALAAFAAFTLPSAILMVLFAVGVTRLEGSVVAGALAGLKVVAVAIVAHAVLGMARTLTPDVRRALIGLAALVVALLAPGTLGNIGAIVVGVVAGVLLCRTRADDAGTGTGTGTGSGSGTGIGTGTGVGERLLVPRRAGLLALAGFTVVVAGLPVLAATVGSPVVDIADAFVRAGSLVFGGGHVVLPLLEAEVVAPGLVGSDDFLAGYAAAQAVPGPLFTFAGYLGVLVEPGPGGVAGAALALAAVFLPGMLILVGILPFWETLRVRPAAQGAIRGVSAAVVGVLAAALYDPVFTTAIIDPATFALAVACFVLLVVAKAPPWSVVVLGAVAGILAALP